MGNITTHGVASGLGEAVELYLKVRREGKVELWETEGGRYAVVSRVKKRGRNPKIRLVERLDAECPECGGPAVAVWKKGAVKALKCLKGHRRKNSKGELETVRPVFLI